MQNNKIENCCQDHGAVIKQFGTERFQLKPLSKGQLTEILKINNAQELVLRSRQYFDIDEEGNYKLKEGITQEQELELLKFQKEIEEKEYEIDCLKLRYACEPNRFNIGFYEVDGIKRELTYDIINEFEPKMFNQLIEECNKLNHIGVAEEKNL